MPQLGILLQCRFCNDFFVFIIREWNDTEDLEEVSSAILQAKLQGGKGKKKSMRKAKIESLQTLFLKEQEKWTKTVSMGEKREQLLFSCARCPTCIERIHKVSYQNWFEIKEAEVIFGLTVPVSFGENESPPLFLNEKGKGEKPRFKLCQGLGPTVLEVDKSYSNRIWKLSLAPYGKCDKKHWKYIDHATATEENSGGLVVCPLSYARIVVEAHEMVEKLNLLGSFSEAKSESEGEKNKPNAFFCLKVIREHSPLCENIEKLKEISMKINENK
eukprot:g1054.t1